MGTEGIRPGNSKSDTLAVVALGLLTRSSGHHRDTLDQTRRGYALAAVGVTVIPTGAHIAAS